MTRNQVEYAKIRETQRSNLEQENLQRAKIQTDAKLGFANLAEASRHNLATEQAQVRSLDETARHNLATEGVAREQLLEQQRSNLVREGLSAEQQSEAKRHNVAVESETHRSNLESEQLKKQSVQVTDWYNHQQVALRQAELAQTAWNQRQAVALRQAELTEESKHNRIAEAETSLHNRNIEQFQLQSLAQNQAQFEANLSEQSRYHDLQISAQRDQAFLNYSVQSERNALTKQQLENTAYFQQGQLENDRLRIEETIAAREQNVALQTTRMQIEREQESRKQDEVERQNEYYRNLNRNQYLLAREQLEISRGSAFFNSVFGGMNALSKFDLSGGNISG